MSNRITPRLRLALGLSLAFAAGCQEPAPPPPVDEAAPSPPSDAPAPSPPSDAPAPSPPSDAPAEPPPPPPPPEEPTAIVITARTFPDELLDRIRLDDLVEVELVRGGGRARGHVKLIRPTEMTVFSGGVLTRLKPDQVRDIRVLFREEDRLDVSDADQPRDPQETWLDRYAWRSILEGQAADLWARRFEPNVALPVVRPFSLTAYSFNGAKGGTASFTPSAQRTTLREGDLLKLAGVVLGLEQRPGAADRQLGELQLYLLKRGGQVQSIYSPERLHPSNLERSAVMRFLEREPVTLSAYKLGRDREYVRIARVPAKTARTYMLHLERTPERSALRAWRAQNHAGVAGAEKAVRALYKAVGLTAESDLDTPVVFELRTTSATGGLRLLGFAKELGMD